MCDRFHCLPSQLRREEASVLRLLHIEALGRREQEMPEGGEV